MEFRQDYYGFIIFFLISIGFLIWWIWARLDYDKRWFVVPWPVVSRGFYFALPTAIIGLIAGLVGLSLPSLDPNFDSVFLSFGLWRICFIVALVEPSWMSPEWYRWLKREHNDIMPYLVMDTHEMGRNTWMQRVETLADLEEWVEEVPRKYRL